MPGKIKPTTTTKKTTQKSQSKPPRDIPSDPVTDDPIVSDSELEPKTVAEAMNTVKVSAQPTQPNKKESTGIGKDNHWRFALSPEELKGWEIDYSTASETANAEGYPTLKNKRGKEPRFDSPPMKWRSGIINGIGSRGTKHPKSDPKRNYFCTVVECEKGDLTEQEFPNYDQVMVEYKAALRAALDRYLDLLWEHPKFRAASKKEKKDSMYETLLEAQEGKITEKRKGELRELANKKARIIFGSEEFTKYPYLRKDDTLLTMHFNRNTYYLPKGTPKKADDPTLKEKNDKPGNEEESTVTTERVPLIESIEEQMKIEQKIFGLGYKRRQAVVFTNSDGVVINDEYGSFKQPVGQNYIVSVTCQFNYWSEKATPKHGFRLDIPQLAILKEGKPDDEANRWVPQWGFAPVKTNLEQIAPQVPALPDPNPVPGVVEEPTESTGGEPQPENKRKRDEEGEQSADEGGGKHQKVSDDESGEGTDPEESGEEESGEEGEN